MARVVPLSINIVSGDNRSLSRQIVDSIRLKISAGELAVGDRLPSVRGLAQQLGVNPNTISKAFAQLIGEGWLTSSAGLGLFVADGASHLNHAEQERRLAIAVDRFVSEIVALRYPPDAALEQVASVFDAIDQRRKA